MKKIWLIRMCSLVALLAVMTVQADPLQVELGGEVFDLELVDDPASRRQGLMGREHLAANEGMLFDFPPDTTPAIWMRNMLISLDLLFVDEQSRLVKIFTEVPPCSATPCDIYRVERPMRFVIELPAGTASRLGLEAGMPLDLGSVSHRSAPAQ
ncbi:DUF192 domain-containing protein [Pseudomonas saliphila]|uniref:DUF192 domain-containing protein n=1 Tax=Pseudomonas saliphila TaxID=2586906 RepID=UPI0019D627F1|nr:DUF192 domain-containing protein [Pseudomonas saliphila]